MSETIRVLIVDDHTIVRSGLRLLLEEEADITVVGDAVDGESAIRQTELLQPHVILMDITMTGMDGIEATEVIKGRWPDVQILILTMHRTDEYFFELLRKGASGYLLKGAETSELLNAIRTVAAGEVFIHPSLTRKLVQSYLDISQSEAIPAALSSLSKREIEILKLLAEGFSNSQIARQLVISPSTVHTHRGNLMKKLKLGNRYELIQYARKHGLI